MLRGFVGAPASGIGGSTRLIGEGDGIARLDKRLGDHDHRMGLGVEPSPNPKFTVPASESCALIDGPVARRFGDDAAAADVERPRLHVRLDRRGDRALDRAERVADVGDAARVDLRRAAGARRERRESGFERRSFTSWHGVDRRPAGADRAARPDVLEAAEEIEASRARRRSPIESLMPSPPLVLRAGRLSCSRCLASTAYLASAPRASERDAVDRDRHPALRGRSGSRAHQVVARAVSPCWTMTAG